jgi:LacI family transcriptional regulator
MRDVATEASVSLKTVSRVVNGATNVDPDLAERVVRAVARLGYRRNDLASSLRAGRSTATIGLIIEDLANPFYSTIASAAAQVAREHDTLLLTSSLEENPEQEQKLVLELCQRRVDGLLIVPAGTDHSYLRPEIEMGIPAVFLDRPPVGLEADTVLIDNRGGAKAAIERLFEHGHERIGVLTDSPSIFTSRDRFDGVRLAFEGSTVPFDRTLVRDGLHEPSAAATAVGELLDGPRPPTAFFSGNNRITIGALTELIRRDSDVELVGFDDFESSALMPRRFTVVTFDDRELGRRGAEMLFGRIAGSRTPPVTSVLPTRLEERGIGPGRS